MSRLLSHCGAHKTALSLSEHAGATARRWATPGTQAWLAATQGYVRACLGERAGSQRALEAARALAARSDRAQEPPWVSFFSDVYVTKWEGHSQLRLGHGEAAYQTFQRVIDDWDPGSIRERAELLAGLADALLQQGEISEACAALGTGLEIAHATGSTRNLHTVQTVRRTMQPWSTTAAVHDLDDRFAALR